MKFRLWALQQHLLVLGINVAAVRASLPWDSLSLHARMGRFCVRIVFALLLSFDLGLV